MATTNALAAVSQAIRYVLEGAFAEEKDALGFESVDVKFDVISSEKFVNAGTSPHVTIFLYRVVPNLALRTPPGRTLPNGSQQRMRLPVDLDLIITVWGSDANTQQQLIGWTMRTLEDYPTLPVTVLNRSFPNTFQRDESVELVLTEMSLEDMLNLWERLSEEKQPYQVSIPYVARAIWLESRRTQPAGAPVQNRVFDIARQDDA